MNNQIYFLLALLCIPLFSLQGLAQDPANDVQRCLHTPERESAFLEWSKMPPVKDGTQGFGLQDRSQMATICHDNMVIPVVFYVIYNGSNGFVSEARILDQFQELQANFAGSGIQLCLATEYNGSTIPLPTAPGVIQTSQSANNPGIIWVEHPQLANYVDFGTASHHQMTALSTLPHDQYLRIFVSPGLAGAYGVAAYPSNPPIEQSILMLSDIIGNSVSCMGICPPTADHGRILAHEVGHYFGLLHIFNGNCGASDTFPGCRLDGDLVCDTPPQLTHANCTPVSTCGFVDIMDNFMDYIPDVCMGAFTPGQIKRMREILVLHRPLLWDPANVTQANVSCTANSYVCDTDVDFQFTVDPNCDVQFTDISTSGSTTIDQWLWDFGDGSPMSFYQHPLHTYPGPGTYDVTLYTQSCDPLTGEYCSCENTISVTVGCTPTVCAANACLTSVSLVSGLTYQFDASCSSGSGPLTYKWFFVDGGTMTTTNPVINYTHTQAVYGGIVQLQVCSTLGLATCDDWYYFSMDVNEPCFATPNFNWSQTNDCEITFSNTSTNSYLGSPQFIWDFGDGSPPSSLWNPTHTYLAPGTYTVELYLNVFDGTNYCDNVIQQQVTVTCVADPCYVDPDFTFSAQGGCGYTFTDISIPDGFTTITNHSWTFGIGMPQTGPNVNVTFPANGLYQVCLTVDAINTQGTMCQFTECKLINVNCGVACANAVNFTYNVVGCTVDFQEMITGDPYTSVSWDFGDGNSSTNPNPSHTFTSGTYTVCLTAECIDPFTGLSHTTTQCQPVTVSCASTCSPPTPLSFTTSVDPVSCEVTWCLDQNLDPAVYCSTWDFGDGNTATLPVGQCAQHLYACPGNYNVCVTVTCCNDPTASTMICETLNHTCGGCAIPTDIGFLPTSSIVGCDLEVDLTYTTLGCPGEVCWQWDFGDGSAPVVGGLNHIHTYAASGNYTVTLTVSCCTDPSISYAVSQILPVNCPCTSVPAFDFFWSMDPATCETEFCPIPSLDPTVYCADWVFGDGTTLQGWPVDQCPVHTYACDGVYTVCVTVYCCSDTTVSTQVCHSVTHTCAPCNIPTDVGFIPIVSLTGCDVDFNLTYTHLGCPGQLCWTWDFGDGSPFVSGGTQVSHTYASNGPFNVVLTVSCCNDPTVGYQVTQTVGVNCTTACPEPCEVFAGFLWDMLPITQANGCCLEFKNTSNHNLYTTITGYQWDFGDGNTSTLQDPSHCYSTPGLYTVTLTVDGQSADGNCSDTFTWEVLCDCQDTCPCDIDGNGFIQIADLLQFLQCWSNSPTCP